MNGDVLMLIGVAAALLTVGVIARERTRPSAPRYGRESEWDDVPSDQFPVLSHFGTDTTEA